MGRTPKPFIKAVKHEDHIDLIPFGLFAGKLRQGSVVTCGVGDRAELREAGEECITKARERFGTQEKQADGSS